jgi:hypothetical protein
VTGVVRKGWVPASYGTLGEQQFKERSIYATASFLGAAVACFASPFPRKLTNSEFTSAAWVQVNADYVVLGGGNEIPRWILYLLSENAASRTLVLPTTSGSRR